MIPALELENVCVDVKDDRESRRLLHHISLRLQTGRLLAVVGESGAGKSTLARAALALTPVSSGKVRWFGKDVTTLSAAQLRSARRDIQCVFEQPTASLSPRRTLLETVMEPLQWHEPTRTISSVEEEALALLSAMGLSARLARRRPRQLSGGQCQRAALARAMILTPRALVCDEILSQLDPDTQMSVLSALRERCERSGTAVMLITHDLELARALANDIIVMRAGAAIPDETSWDVVAAVRTSAERSRRL
jgi:peptide/nickel transport system ATP-binding protein